MRTLNLYPVLAGLAPALLVSFQALAAAAPATPPAAAPAAIAAPLTGQRVIQVLDQAIDWFRTLGIQQQAANEPSDLLILYDNRQIANQVIALAFEIARADVDVLAKQPATKDSGGTAAATQLSQLESKYAAQGAAVHSELESVQTQLAKSAAEQRNVLQAKISELQGELELIDARTTLLATMSSLTSQTIPAASARAA